MTRRVGVPTRHGKPRQQQYLLQSQWTERQTPQSVITSGGNIPLPSRWWTSMVFALLISAFSFAFRRLENSLVSVVPHRKGRERAILFFRGQFESEKEFLSTFFSFVQVIVSFGSLFKFWSWWHFKLQKFAVWNYVKNYVHQAFENHR